MDEWILKHRQELVQVLRDGTQVAEPEIAEDPQIPDADLGVALEAALAAEDEDEPAPAER